jgi:hypothetical protein
VLGAGDGSTEESSGAADVTSALRSALDGVPVRVDGMLADGDATAALGAFDGDARRLHPTVRRAAARALR